ncbi:MAG: hypothetical protein O7D91_18215 [Planctomycetota bacterium]|nr:hypothetical protein [Planctomycetota bacterium]
MTTATMIILGIAGVVTVLPILFTSLITLRNAWAEAGLPLPKRLKESWLSSQSRTIALVLDELGWRGEQIQALRDATEAGSTRVHDVSGDATELAREVVRAIRPLTRPLPEGSHWGDNNHYYVHTIGTTYPPALGHRLAELMVDWLAIIETAQKLRRIDCVLANKQGNPTFASDVCRLLSTPGEIPAIVCKHEKDRSRVNHTQPLPHVTDFEGLEAFLEAKQRDIKRGVRLRAIAIDDQCAGGSGLCGLVERFNQLVERQGLPFDKVTDVVVLFVINDKETKKNFDKGSGVRLHAVLSSLGDEEKQLIMEMDPDTGLDDISRLQRGVGCETIRELAAQAAR